MSAKKVLELAEKQGLFDAKVTAELRRKMAESKFIVTPEAIAKILVDHGHLTPFQARKLVGTALGPQPEYDPPPAEANADDDEIVMLDAVEPAPQSVASAKTTPSKPTAKPPRPAAPAPRPGSDEVMGMADLEIFDAPVASAPVTAPAAKSRSAKPSASDLEAIDLSDDLTPLSSAGDAAPAGLTPLDDLFGPAPGASLGPADPLAPGSPLQTPAAISGVKKKHNQWDSPLLLVGGGVLGALVLASVLLFYALTRGTAAELFAKAEEEYQAASYSSAIATYEHFLNQYPKSAQASLARVRREMSQLRQVTDGGADPRQGLSVAKRVLPLIEQEPEFEQARIELTSILPEITDGFATQAKQSGDTARREELVKLAEESLTLVNNPVYLPAARRKEAEHRIASALEKLKAARRSIDQDKDLQTALGQIRESLTAANIAEAYQLRNTLVRTYPGLEAHPEISKVTLEASAKERDLVRTAPFESAASTADPRPASTRILLASRSGGEAASGQGQIAFLLLEGAVYALDVSSGKVLWRRHVGFETTVHPVAASRNAGADALVVDARSQELLRLEGATGNLLWRQKLGDVSLAPVVAGDSIFVTSRQGHISLLEANTGAAGVRATLPQEANVPACFDTKRSRLYQLARHSSLFVLRGDTLRCEETVYLGHKAGSILVPPVAVLDALILAESPSDDYTLIHVLAPRGEKKLLTSVSKPFRLAGRVVLPLSVSGRRVATVTDLGQVAVFEIDPTNPDRPVLLVGSFAPTEKVPLFSHYITTGNELFVTGRRCTKYDIQSSLQQLARRWTLHQDHAFVAPLQIFGGVLLHARRHPGSPAILVEACQTSDGKAIWTTQLGAPLVALAVSEAREQLVAITSQARVFEIPRAAIGAGYFDQPTFVPLAGQAPTVLNSALDLGNGRLLCSGFKASGPALLYEGSAESNRVRIVMFPEAAGAAAALPIAFRQSVLVPLVNGRVALFDPLKGTPTLLPFQPQLAVGANLAWQRPTVLPPSGDAFVIGDGKQMVYRVAVQDQPQPHLSAAVESPLEGDLTSPLAAAGDTVYGVVRGEISDTVISLSASDLAPGMKWPLQGRCQMGPEEAGGLVFVAAEPDGLLCLEAGQKLRWTTPLKYGPLAGPPRLCDGDFVMLSQRGVVVRLAAETGQEVATVDVGEPLGPAAFVMGSRVLVSGYDGVLHIIPVPKRQ